MSGSEFIQTLLSGLSLGGTYAIIALGFVVVYSATRVLSFVQAGAVLAGGYLTYALGPLGAGMPFVVAALVSAAITGLVLMLAGELVVGPLVRKGERDAASIATIGLYFVVVALVDAVFGVNPRNLGDPWGLDTIEVLGATVAVSSLWKVAISAVLAAGWFLILQRTRVGLGMRAMVSDREAALAQGVQPRRVTAFVWVVAGATAAIAGTLLATGSGGVNSTLSTVPFLVLPAIVLGGLQSPVGAVVGGMIIGIVQQFTALLQPEFLPALGSRFASIVPFIVLLVVLLLRPNGLFGTRAVQRF